MEFLLFCLGTSVTSFCMEMANELRMFKDVADAGYKIDLRRMSELQKQLLPDAAKITFLSMLIPIFNIMQVFKNTIQYNNIRPMILDQLSAMDVLEEMSEIEKQEYLKKPSSLNALIVPLKTEIRLAKASSIKIEDGDVTGEIYFEWHNRKSLSDITILKSTGDISKLPINEQKIKIIEAYKAVIEEGIKKYGDVDELINAVKSNPKLDLTHSSVEITEDAKETKKELSTREKIQALQELKDEIGNQQNTQKQNTETGPKLTKKRK